MHIYSVIHIVVGAYVYISPINPECWIWRVYPFHDVIISIVLNHIIWLNDRLSRTSLYIGVRLSRLCETYCRHGGYHDIDHTLYSCCLVHICNCFFAFLSWYNTVYTILYNASNLNLWIKWISFVWIWWTYQNNISRLGIYWVIYCSTREEMHFHILRLDVYLYLYIPLIILSIRRTVSTWWY